MWMVTRDSVLAIVSLPASSATARDLGVRRRLVSGESDSTADNLVALRPDKLEPHAILIVEIESGRQ